MSQAEWSDDQLVHLALEGDADAFVELVKRYDKPTRATAYAAVGPNGPFEDGLQEGLFKAYNALGTFTLGSNFRGWLCRVVYNAAIDQVRQQKRVVSFDQTKANHSFVNGLPVRFHRSVAVARQHVDSFSFEAGVIHEMDLRATLDSLPEKQRSALILVDIEGYNYDTAAEMLGVPRGTIASRVSHARNALRLSFSASAKDNQ